MTNTIHTGVVKFYNVGRLYGFIIDNDTGKEYFCHNDGLIDHIKKGDTVTFEIITGIKGLNAVSVKLLNSLNFICNDNNNRK